ncbi:DUF2931 family protein [Cellvibrio sp. QJXJ]|uniref:DUF2931 family protein n=1 Tax=Cellvibrio sp. QJXJ TaxID=2964606 RepID=UPI0021C4A8AF|nr:DUF2931 family protein [Cellvibrio sp. QJXJ]UUA75098.1 DUF2931 family protein [Cellvibrio sp. QJXJ]
MKFKTLLSSGLTGLFIFLTGCGSAMSKNPTTFDWLATESAPSHYPMKIIQGDLFYHGQGGSRYIPSGGTLRAGWGSSISTHIGGDELYPLPDRLSIVFFSLTENQFYQGEFDLPYEKILALFREGIIADKKSPYYRKVMVGVAPGGVVSVWLTGNRTKEVFFGQAEKIDLSYGRATGLPFDGKHDEDSFIKGILEDVLKPEELESLKKDGVPFGLWARYRTLYTWNLKSGGAVPFKHEIIGMKYLNGESGRTDYPFTEELVKTPRPLPRWISVTPKFTNRNTNYRLHFNEFELMNAFEKLGANGEEVTIECDARMPREDARLRVYNDKESIELKKTRVSDR